MSFSKNLIHYSKQLNSWIHSPPSNVKGSKEVINFPGASIEITYQDKNVFFHMTSGHISEIQQGLLEALAQYINKYKIIPTMRELDFYLRDLPHQASWPEHLDLMFMEKTMGFLETVYNQAETPIIWLKNKLSSFDLSKYKINGDKQNFIIITGSKIDAWVIEKNFELWQKQIRELFNLPELVLLYSIKS